MVVVVVEVAPEPPPEVAQAAIDGCNGALGAGSCRLGADQPSEFHALVRADPTQPGVFIVELRQRTRAGPVLETRELHFAEQDTSLERSTSLGVVIAALVAAQERRERAVARPAPAPITPRSAPTARIEARAVPRSRWLRIDAGATLNRAMEQHPLALGGLGRLSKVLEPWPVFASLSAGYESGITAEPELGWFFGAIGLGAALGLPGSPLALEFHSEALAERVVIEAQDPAGPATASTSRWRAGGRCGIDGIWSWSERLGLVLGLQVSLLRPALLIEVSNQSVEKAPVFAGGFFLGLRYSL